MTWLIVLLGVLYGILIVVLKTIDSLSIPLFLVFLVLKLCGVIAWEWVYVCLPLIVFAGSMILTIICVAIHTAVAVKQGE